VASAAEVFRPPPVGSGYASIDRFGYFDRNVPDLFMRWLYGGIQDLGEPAVTELVLEWTTRLSRWLNATDRGVAPGREPVNLSLSSAFMDL